MFCSQTLSSINSIQSIEDPISPLQKKIISHLTGFPIISSLTGPILDTLKSNLVQFKLRYLANLLIVYKKELAEFGDLVTVDLKKAHAVAVANNASYLDFEVKIPACQANQFLIECLADSVGGVFIGAPAPANPCIRVHMM
jgi:hypothetical protein